MSSINDFEIRFDVNENGLRKALWEGDVIRIMGYRFSDGHMTLSVESTNLNLSGIALACWSSGERHFEFEPDDLIEFRFASDLARFFAELKDADDWIVEAFDYLASA